MVMGHDLLKPDLFVKILFQLPTFFNTIVNVFKMVLPKKMTERLVLVGSDKSK